MLFDILGMMIGFTAIMALFSLVVTGLVQTIQSTFQLRSKNLALGIRDLQSALPPDLRCEPERVMAKLTEMLPIQGKPTEVTQDELNNALHALAPSAQPFVVSDELFKRFEEGLSSRFRFWTKWVGFGSALVIAVYFQVSTPDLINALGTQPEFRKQAEEVGAELLEKEAPKAIDDYSAVAAPAVERLSAKHPELKERLEEVSGQAKSRASALAELRLVLGDTNSRELGPVVESYQKILDELEGKRVEADVRAGKEAQSVLAGLNMTPWAKGKGFYVEKGWFGRVIGVLITAALLTLGAPFWFQKLRELSGLKDVFADRRKEGGAIEAKPPRRA